MGKKILIVSIVFMVLFTVVYGLIAKDVITLPTVGSDSGTRAEIISVEDLEDSCYYVWHNTNSTIAEDLNGAVDQDVFTLCPSGIINWNKNKNISHTIWFSSENDYEIPTLYPGDVLIYISPTQAMSDDGFKWERFADYGYTIGVANMNWTKSGHYRIICDDGKYEGYLNYESDTAVLDKYTNVLELYLDKIGNVPVRDTLVSEGGTVLGLDKDGKYLCEWYTGTYYQDYEMQADSHAFCSMESFTTYEYEFLHSKAISIIIPEWFKTGYYYIEGAGMFRYVSMKDLSAYNGLAYDKNVNWNDPIILHDERGFVIYDPSTGIDKTAENIKTETIKESQAAQDEFFTDDGLNRNIEVNENTDGGAEMYEDFYEVQYIE